ncbi:S-adenosyl-L-methionine-dependent tRNA 4-demethylwyosine synthase [Elsinoe australis]|uniref:S-adenosyl-L-methionine-dependent tRNA 4-demethylwyosine synthase n=1 Tax=Elsinoe australis TaxID=40998 RepID=A0A2P7ZTW4_9PEZI|nr:S-adenosyl-L-methionine-dependent tRNA 4-demethylwyosine synthase [Elsinoe australis]
MPVSTILRLRRTDADTEEFVVARVEQTSSSRLDLQLTATDGVSPFTAKVRHNAVDKLQNKSSKTSLEQWHTILYALLLQQPEYLNDETAKDVEAVATVNGEVDITLAIRKNIGGITQRLGDIVLTRDDDIEVDAILWAAEAALKVTKIQGLSTTLQAKVDQQDQLITSLQRSLEELVKEREGQQEKLLHRFATLLNSKKLKIRDQQRLLSRAGLVLDDDNGHQMATKRPQKGSARKRKAASAEAEATEEEETADAHGNTNMSDVTEGEETPDPSSEEDSDEAMHEQDVTKLNASNGDGEVTPSNEKEKKLSIPPKRDLPYGMSRGTGKAVQKSAAPSNANDGDDETDDEL